MVNFLLDLIDPSQLSAALGHDVVVTGAGVSRSVVVPPEHLVATMQALATKEEFSFDYLGDVTSVDRGANGIEVVYQLYSLSKGLELRVKTTTSADGATVPTMSTIWPGADWLEREVYDLMGVTFEGHPNMKRILLPDDFEGHPLRKSFKLQARA